jgi:Na+/proline symporter
MLNLPLLAIIAYLLLQLAVAAYANRRIKSEADYLLGGRNFGLWLGSFSLFATWFGAETVIASSGAVALGGLSAGRAEPFGYALCLVLFAVLIAAKLRAGNYLTMADFFAKRFGAWAEKCSVVLIIPTSLLWASAQILAFAHVLSAVAGIELATALALGTAMVVIYTTIGGFLGDVLTDNIQGVVVIIGLVVTAAFVVQALGGWDMALAQIAPERLSVIAPDEPLWAQADEWAIAIIGSLVAQEAISRILATRTPRIATQTCYVAAGLYFTVGLIPVFIGLVGFGLVPAEVHGDAFLPHLAQSVLPDFAYVLFIGALISAILSTVNTTLLSIGGLVGHNLIIHARPHWFRVEGSKILLQRLVVALAGLLAYSIAATGDDIYTLIQNSSSFGSAGLVVCLLFGLWFRFGGMASALAAMIIGTLGNFVLQDIVEWPVAYLGSLGLAAVVYAVVAEVSIVRQLQHRSDVPRAM